MCDNCKQGLQVFEKDFSQESIKILDLIIKIEKNVSQITLKQLTDIFRGKTVKSQMIR